MDCNDSVYCTSLRNMFAAPLEVSFRKEGRLKKCGQNLKMVLINMKFTYITQSYITQQFNDLLSKIHTKWKP